MPYEGITIATIESVKVTPVKRISVNYFEV